MPIDYKKYHPQWKWISQFVRRVRAKNTCEQCGVPNYAVGHREDGVFIPIRGNIYADMAGKGISYPSMQPISYKEAREWADAENENDYDGRHFIVIVLTTAHLDHDIENNELDNLKALCQKCHNDHDKDHRLNNRLKKKNQMQFDYEET